MTDPLLASLATIVGEDRLLTDPADVAPYLHDERRRFTGDAAAIVQPADTDEVAAVVAACAAVRRPVVPQGGNTGLCAGATPPEGSDAVVISLERLRDIRRVDAENYTITVGAGVTVAAVADAAREAGRLFPLRFGADGTAQIGGALSTNAGGMQVLRYGSARALTLGVEVVMADARVFSDLSGLRKDNTGYRLTDLFVGAEGTLGVITAATLRLFPSPAETITALAATTSIDNAIELLALVRSATDDRLDAFEWMGRGALAMLPRKGPLTDRGTDLVLLEATSGAADSSLASSVESAIAVAAERRLIEDAVVAASGRDREVFWSLREGLPEAERQAGGSVKHDVSVPVSAIAQLMEAASAGVAAVAPDATIVPFGHLGDGNIHFNVVGCAPDEEEPTTAAIFDAVASLGGSFSAEHGVGRLRREELLLRASPVQIDAMRAVKSALDPDGIMNPGAVL